MIKTSANCSADNNILISPVKRKLYCEHSVSIVLILRVLYYLAVIRKLLFAKGIKITYYYIRYNIHSFSKQVSPICTNRIFIVVKFNS